MMKNILDIRSIFSNTLSKKSDSYVALFQFVPRVALHWFAILLFAIVSTITIAITIAFISGPSVYIDGTQPKAKSGTVLNAKLLDDTLNVYRAKSLRVEQLKYTAPESIDPMQ